MRHLAAATAVLFVLLCALPAAAAPRVEATRNEFDFGRIHQGDKVRHIFTFTNAGDEPLNVSKVSTSCGCTAALVSSRVLEPGETGEISVTFDSARFRGNIRKTVSLYTDDPTQSITTFALHGTIEQEIAYRPARLTLGPVGAEQTAEGEVALTNHGDKQVELEVARVSLAEMTARLERTALPPAASTKLRVEVTPKKGQKRLSGWVILETDSESTPQIRIPVLVTVR